MCVTVQVSEFAEENDLREIFERFGRVTRVFLAKDRDTQRAKGFAFISFQERSDAARACEKIDGCKCCPFHSKYPNFIQHKTWEILLKADCHCDIDGYGHLILRVEFAKRAS